MSLIVRVVMLMFLAVCTIVASDPIVKLDHGKGTVLGKRMQIQAKETNYEADIYLGIPYAEPPVGDLRFKPPVPKELTGEFNAQEYGKICPQLDTIFPFSAVDLSSEDCLILNVYVPVPTVGKLNDKLHGSESNLTFCSWLNLKPI